jgi:dTMP kinase
MDGIFISFEGIDGAGKSTHIEPLARVFREQGRTVTLTREPGGTPLAERLRALVLNEPMDSMTEAFLMFASRRDHLVSVIAPALARGEVVLCDRFADASFAYQGSGRGFSWDVLTTLEQWVLRLADTDPTSKSTPLLQPQLTFWFDLPASVAAERLAGARTPDKFEAQSEAFFERVAQGYARRMADDPARFARINADQAAQAVWLEVEQVARSRGLLA